MMLINARLRNLAILAVFIVIISLSTIPAEATTLNLLTAGTTGTLVGAPGGTAVFIQGATLSGSGVFPAFVQVTGNDPIHDAYNTTVNNVGDNGASDIFNHEVALSSVPIFTQGGVSYYSFFLDINEANNAIDKYLSLDLLTVTTSPTANQSSTPLPTGTTRWSMAATDNIVLNFDLESGSGRADMEFLVPLSAFAGALPTDFVYLYSSFGALGINPSGLPAGNYGNSGGTFEEWALGRSGGSVPSVPEPNSLLLLGTGLVTVALAARRKFAAK
jgi:PEP-CTERM motif